MTHLFSRQLTHLVATAATLA
ncbi:MAG: hypothetical protein RLZZ498_291, partial [Pseudomonadota bacterium]